MTIFKGYVIGNCSDGLIECPKRDRAVMLDFLATMQNASHALHKKNSSPHGI